MRHLIIAEHGSFVGLKSERLVLSRSDEVYREIPLNNLRTITIAKNGVAFSSDLVLSCAERGISLFITNFKGETTSVLIGAGQHAVAEVRKRQFIHVESRKGRQLAATIIYSKIRNQRAVIAYYGKYRKKTDSNSYLQLLDAMNVLADYANQVRKVNLDSDKWRSEVMGLEGLAASLYFSVWPLLGVPFHRRIGRGAKDAVNAALNYGYAILKSYVWTAVINAGLEPYAGFLHVDRPGKPSLVLDLMEEYRAWVVDRAVIKLMDKSAACEFDADLRRRLAREILQALGSKVLYRGKRIRLETLIQRRVYRLSGALCSEASYPPILFKW